MVQKVKNISPCQDTYLLLVEKLMDAEGDERQRVFIGALSALTYLCIATGTKRKSLDKAIGETWDLMKEAIEMAELLELPTPVPSVSKGSN